MSLTGQEKGEAAKQVDAALAQPRPQALTPLERLALEVSTCAPPRPPKHRHRSAYIPWTVVLDIRAQLEARGIDWQAAVKALRAAKGYRS